MACSLPAQVMRSYNEDSLRAILDKTPQDTVRVNILRQLAQSYFFKQPDSSLLYSEQALELSRELNYISGIQWCLFLAGETNRHKGKIIEAMKLHHESLEFNQKIGNEHFEANALGFIGLNYFELHDYRQALSYLRRGVAIRKRLKPPEPTEALFDIYIGKTYIAISRFDSALYFLREAEKAFTAEAQLRITQTISFGDFYIQIGKKDSADLYYRAALKYVLANPELVPMHLSMLGVSLSEVYSSQNKLDSSFYFARYAYQVAKRRNMNSRVLEASRVLSQLYRQKGILDSTLYYQDIANAMSDSIYGGDRISNLQLLVLQEQRRNQEIQQAEERRRNTIQLIGLVSITTVILIASILLFRSNRIKHKTNHALQKTLTELRSTQSQLIQSEKMASLGELTAGIAHEIQNPLNFVNNFAEVNKELIADMEAAIQNGSIEEAKGIARNIADNQEKINSHGKRADAIVKSMLQHSRSSSGQKELTDVNALCDEYLRLTYHGYRAKDKSFNAKLNTSFDPTMPKVNVVRQDIGRVLLNIINNAFYAINESAVAKAMADKSGGSESMADGKYEPTIIVSTKNLGNKIEISVKDNGNGIPESVKEKIFQPFFTTKPTGQGSGLGLSLSYDIVKAHGGELFVRTEEGIGSEFIIRL